MSRIGKLPVVIPSGVEITITGNSLTVKGPKGTLTQNFPAEINVAKENGEILVTRNSDHRTHKAKHGLTRSLINNMVVGVTEGFTRKLVIEGVGYKASVSGRNLTLNLGYSHPIEFNPPDGIEFVVDKTGTQLSVNGSDKFMVGEVASQIRRLRMPEPYKGKGVRYSDESIRRKAGKTGKAK